jgi:hypothetical protein
MTEEKKQDKPVALFFLDAKGRVWSPRIDCRVMDEFERHIGVGVFEAVFNALLSQKTPTKKGKQPDATTGQKLVLELSRAIFGRVGSLTFLLYEACRPAGNPALSPCAHYADPDSAPEGTEGKEVDYSDFRASIGKEQVNAAMMVALNALFDFFPELDEKDARGEGDNSPFARFLGAMSTNVRP